MQIATLQRCLGAPRAAGRRAARSQRTAVTVRAQQGGHQGPASGQQAAAAAQAVADAAAPQQQHSEDEEGFDEVASAGADVPAAYGAEDAGEQQAAVAVPPPGAAQPSGGLPYGLSLQHPAVKYAAIGAGIFLAGTFVLSLFRNSDAKQKAKRERTINKNKAVIQTIGKFLPGNRAAMSSGSFTLLKMQTGFSSVEIFRKYLNYLVRERDFNEEALADLVALKQALALSDEQVAEALAERAQRTYEKYGTVMVNTEGLSEEGVQRKAATRVLFIKLLSLTESRQLLSAEAATKVDLSKIFGVTPRDILTLRSGYSAESEGSGTGGAAGAGGDDEE